MVSGNGANLSGGSVFLVNTAPGVFLHENSSGCSEKRVAFGASFDRSWLQTIGPYFDDPLGHFLDQK